MSRFAGERTVVVGLGVSGAAAAEVLAAEGAHVLVSEARQPEDVELPAALRDLGVELSAGGNAPEHLEGATIVVPSPGVSPDTPILREAA
jgi:UDP-N-acetylmuramoylalanine--D-glutamate ligase